ncbi:Fur family transcriptional regulator [Desulfocarbo indianensis]|nr:Fur family transcriptional regulator [Desulfocarbo indianensis]
MTDGKQRLENMLEALKSRGYRITPQRLAILKILAQSRGHPSVESIHKEVKAVFPTTSLATIYKTLTLLKELGQVLELGFADWGSRYDGNRPYPHPHIICTKCGAIVDPESESMSVMTQEMSQASGFRITHHRLDFFGLCPQCQKEE